MARIAVAGFQHETNSLGVGRADLAAFEMADSWPGLLAGAEVLSGTAGLNLPIAGFAAAARAAGAGLHPILWCAAEPSGPVTDAAFETVLGRILKGLRSAGPLDGVYLDLHGAMITDRHADGEGEILARVRGVVGDVPLAVSLDMHANVSARMAALADVICIYKTYPHLDMAETGARAWHRLAARLAGARPARAFRQAAFQVPLHAQHTDAGAPQALYAGLPDSSTAQVEMALGFTAGDTPDARPAVLAYAPSAAEADRLAGAALAALTKAEARFDTALTPPDTAIAEALAAPRGKPVILADVQDNPGAGAGSDTTGLMRALIAAEAPGALLGLMHDPALAAAAQAAGPGAVIAGAMGGRSGTPGDTPLTGRFRVCALSDGRVRYSGAMYGGGIAVLGPSCALRLEDTKAEITVVVTSRRSQCLDLALFTHFGLAPHEARIVAVKSTAHFRADFAPIAARVIPVAAPGLFPCAPPFLGAQSMDTSV